MRAAPSKIDRWRSLAETALKVAIDIEAAGIVDADSAGPDMERAALRGLLAPMRAAEAPVGLGYAGPFLDLARTLAERDLSWPAQARLAGALKERARALIEALDALPAGRRFRADVDG